MNWREFFDGDHAIYVSQRHKQLHAKIVGRDILALIPSRDAHLLDHGCGEALYAESLAAACGRLWLCDSGPTLRAQLAARMVNRPNVSVVAPETVEIAIPDDSLDLVTVISLAQYLKKPELAELMGLWLAKLKPGGILVIGDVIPPDLSAATDARALLSFAWKGGFLWAALAGLAKTALSDYRKIRAELGLTSWTAAELDKALHEAGFSAVRRRDNIGHNSARMTFIAQKRV